MSLLLVRRAGWKKTPLMAAPQDGDIPTRVRLYVIKATLKLFGQMILKWLGQVLTLTFLHYSKLLLLTVSIGIIIKTIMSGCIFMFSCCLLQFFRNKSKNKRAILETSPSWCHKWPWYLAESCPTHSQVLALLSEIAWFLSSSKRGIYRATFPVGSQKM